MQSGRQWWLWGWLALAVPPAQADDDAAQVEGLERQLAAAIADGDLDRVNAHLSRDYVHAIGTDAGFVQLTWKAWQTKLGDYRISHWKIDELHARVHGDTAFVRMLYWQEASTPQGARGGQFVVSDVWLKTDGRWQLVDRVTSRPEPRDTPKP